MKRRTLQSFLIPVLAGLLLMPGVGSALTVLQLNLDQLYSLSEKVFLGRCISVRPETDAAGRRIEEVTFAVNSMLKGEPETTVVFRQLSGRGSDLMEGVGGSVIGESLPRYEAGEEAVIFLSAESDIGLTAPVGLFQGKFGVVQTADGIKSVRNGLNNRGLFAAWRKNPRLKSMGRSPALRELLQRNGGAIRLEDFLSLIQGLSSS